MLKQITSTIPHEANEIRAKVRNDAVQSETPRAQMVYEAIREAAAELAQELKKVPYLRYREGNCTRTLEVIPRDEGHCLLKFQRLPDGSLSITTDGEPADLRVVPSNDTIRANALQAVATAIVRNGLLKLRGERLSPAEIAGRRVSSAAREQAHTLLGNLQERNEIPAWLQGRYNDRERHEPEKTIKLLLTSEETLYLLDRYKHSYQGHTVREYNTVHLNREVFKALEERKNQPLHYYLNRMAPHEPEVRVFSGPAELTKLVRNQVRLPDDLWNTFTKIPHNAWPEDTALPPRLAEHICRIVKKANPPPDKEENLQYAVSRLCQLRPQERRWDHGDPDQPWANLLNEFMKFPARPHSLRTEYPVQQFNHIADAIQSAIASNAPWPNARWDHLCQRADRWQRETLRENERLSQEASRKLLETRWDSLVSTTTLDDYTFVPVENAVELINLAKELNNCLSSYVNSCAANNTRVFRVDQEGLPIGAVSLINTSGKWEPDQAEAHERARLPKEVGRHHLQLSKMYNEQEPATASE